MNGKLPVAWQAAIVTSMPMVSEVTSFFSTWKEIGRPWNVVPVKIPSEAPADVPSCVTEKVRPATERAPVRVAAPGFAATA